MDVEETALLDRAEVVVLLSLMFKERSVPHVVAGILDYAEFWEVSTGSFESHGDPRCVTGYAPDPPYAISKKLPGDAGKIYCDGPRLAFSSLQRPCISQPVRKAIFRLTGCNQGWASAEGHWSWWCLSKEHRQNADEVTQQVVSTGESDLESEDSSTTTGAEENWDLSEPIVPSQIRRFGRPRRSSSIRRKADREQLSRKWPEGPQLAVSERHNSRLQNFEVEVDCVHNRVLFSPDMSDRFHNNDIGHNEDALLDFVRSLQPGDSVGILARAMFPGWECNTTRAEVEIYTMTY